MLALTLLIAGLLLVSTAIQVERHLNLVSLLVGDSTLSAPTTDSAASTS